MGDCKKHKIIVSGHICLDLTPAFLPNEEKASKDIFIPGSLIEMGDVDIHTGGAVANTGLALKILGADVQLMGKIGRDNFGSIVLTRLKEYDAHQHMIISEDTETSYSIVLAPAGFDRIFLHHPGANDTFSYSDIDFTCFEGASLFHFGYPPLMASMYQDGGRELVRIFKEAKARQVLTSLDMAAVNEGNKAGCADWEQILKDVLPYVDFFVPSIEELVYMMDRTKYCALKERAGQDDMISVLSVKEDVKPLADRLLEWGAKVVMIKCGSLGLYFRTASADTLNAVGPDAVLDLSSWAEVEHFESSYRPTRILSGTGAGDTCIAAFLYSALRNYPWQRCLQLAAAAGAACISAYDALSAIPSLDELNRMIDEGWEKNEVPDL